MIVNELVLEVTRKCNLKCQHCMRGAAQRMNMSREVIVNTLSGIDQINDITFTGGEPSLAVDVIEEIILCIIWRKISVEFFYVVTNGKNTRNRIRLLEALFKLYNRCESPESCSLQVSGDQFHNYEIGTPNETHLDGYLIEEFGERYYKEVPFYHGHKSGYITNVLNEGRAAQYNSGNKDPEKQPLWEVYDEGDFQVNENEVYISANGNVTSNCNMSFARIDREAKGNVLKESLYEIIQRNSKNLYKEEEKIA